MEDKFNKLKNGLKLKIALAFVITTIFAALFLTLGIKNKNGILYMCFALSYLFIFPILIFLFNIGFDGIKTEIIEKTVNQNLEEPFKFSLYKAIGGKEIEVLKLNEISNYYSVSAVYEASNDDKKFISYCVKFVGPKKKRYVGKIIHIEGISNVNLPKNDFLYQENEYKKIKSIHNDFYLFVAKEYKKKNYINYSLEPLDFKTYSDYEKRVRKEISFYKELFK